MKLSTVPIIGDPGTADWDENSREKSFDGKVYTRNEEIQENLCFTESCEGI